MEEVPMANLKIKDIETLERLSDEVMKQVVGGSFCPFATASSAIDDEPVIIIDDPVVPGGPLDNGFDPDPVV